MKTSMANEFAELDVPLGTATLEAVDVEGGGDAC